MYAISYFCSPVYIRGSHKQHLYLLLRYNSLYWIRMLDWEYMQQDQSVTNLKSIPLKEAWSNFWHNLNDSKRAIFTSLPHFDPIKFEKITGIKI